MGVVKDVFVRAFPHPEITSQLSIVVQDADGNPAEEIELSFNDEDQIRWIAPDTGLPGRTQEELAGNLTVLLATQNNPFTPPPQLGDELPSDAVTPTTDLWAPSGGAYLSPPPADPKPGVILGEGEEVSTVYDYSISVSSVDGTRQGATDPRVRVRRRGPYIQ